MNWNDYEAVWKRQELPVGADADLVSLRATFETKSRKLHAALLAGDFAEAGAGVIVAGAYAFFWWQVGRSGWPLALAIILVLGVSVFFIRERLRARRGRLSVDAPMLAKVEADINELKHRRRLVRDMWAWYLAPIAAAMIIQFFVLAQRPALRDLMRDPFILAGFGVFSALMFWFAWFINHRAVRKQIDPRLKELEKLRRDLLSSA